MKKKKKYKKYKYKKYYSIAIRHNLKYNPITTIKNEDWEKIDFENIPDDVWAKEMKEVVEKIINRFKNHQD